MSPKKNMSFSVGDCALVDPLREIRDPFFDTGHWESSLEALPNHLWNATKEKGVADPIFSVPARPESKYDSNAKSPWAKVVPMPLT